MIKRNGRIFVKCQIFNREFEGQDIIVPDEFGINWQIKDKAKVELPLSIVTALEDAIIDRYMIKEKHRSVTKEQRYIIYRLDDNAKLDATEEEDLEDELADESLMEARRAAARAPQNPEGRKKKIKGDKEKINLEDSGGEE